MKTAIINSVLDNDFYKFTMQQAVVKLFPKSKSKYEFINRGKHEFPGGFSDLLRNQINQLAGIGLTPEEKQFLAKTCPYLDPTYLDFLQGFRYDPTEVRIEQYGTDIKVFIEGYWYRTILWEVPIMALISELYYRSKDLKRISDDELTTTLVNKVEGFQKLDVKIAEFGTRRRHSFEVQDRVNQIFASQHHSFYSGSSNVFMAMKYGVKPIGTHAHEWFMYHGARYGFKMANAMGLENWTEVYRGDLGVALTDTYTTNVFFKQFDKKFSKLFDGVRHDSGDPLEFANKTIAHYQQMGIDPISKYIIFSDGLNLEKVARIAAHCRGKIGMAFGIGTNLTNDVGLPPMNIVLKMMTTMPDDEEWTDVVKISDEKNKHTGSLRMITLCKALLEIE